VLLHSAGRLGLWVHGILTAYLLAQPALFSQGCNPNHSFTSPSIPIASILTPPPFFSSFRAPGPGEHNVLRLVSTREEFSRSTTSRIGAKPVAHSHAVYGTLPYLSTSLHIHPFAHSRVKCTCTRTHAPLTARMQSLQLFPFRQGLSSFHLSPHLPHTHTHLLLLIHHHRYNPVQKTYSPQGTNSRGVYTAAKNNATPAPNSYQAHRDLEPKSSVVSAGGVADVSSFIPLGGGGLTSPIGC
jgi:hypothetical protein